MNRTTRWGVLAAVLAAGMLAAPVPAQERDRDAERAAREAEREMREAEQRLREAQAQLERAARRLAELESRQAIGGLPTRMLVYLGGRPRLGIVVETKADPRFDKVGARVVAVTPGGPADEAGLRAGDVITAIDGEPLPGPAGDLDVDEDESVPAARLMELLSDLDEGQEVTVTFRRGSAERTVKVQARRIAGPDVRAFVDKDIVIAAPHAPGLAPLERRDEWERLRFAWDPAWEGIELVALNPELGEYFATSEGVLVVKVPKGSELGLRPGDVILEVDGRTPRSPAQVLRILDSYEPGESVRVVVMRGKQRQELSLRVPERPAESRRVVVRRLAEPPAPPTTPAPPAPPTPPTREPV